jgi:hypothetical protein
VEFLKNKIKAMRTFATETALSSALGAYDGEVVSVSVTGNIYVWKSATGTWEIQVKRNTDGSYVLPFGSVSATGGWTIGPASYAGAHTVNGNVEISSGEYLQLSQTAKFRFQPNPGANDYLDLLTGTGTPTTVVARVIDTGAWTLGPSSFTGAHTVNGNQLLVKSSSGSAASLSSAADSNTYFDTQGINTSTNGGFVFRSYRSDSTNIIQTGLISATGAWTLGPASYAGSHTVNGTLTCTYTTNSRVDVLLSNTNTGSGAAACYLLQANGGYAYIVKVGTANAGYGGADSLSVVNETGGSYLAPGGTTWQVISDMRCKTKVADFHPVLDKLSTLSVFTYQLNESLDAGKAPVELGLSAQEMLLVAPEIVSGSEETKYGISYDRLGVVLVKAIQEQQQQIEQLQSEIALLKGA